MLGSMTPMCPVGQVTPRQENVLSVRSSKSRASMILLCIQTDIVLGEPVRKLS